MSFVTDSTPEQFMADDKAVSGFGESIAVVTGTEKDQVTVLGASKKNTENRRKLLANELDIAYVISFGLVGAAGAGAEEAQAAATEAVATRLTDAITSGSYAKALAILFSADEAASYALFGPVDEAASVAAVKTAMVTFTFASPAQSDDQPDGRADAQSDSFADAQSDGRADAQSDSPPDGSDVHSDGPDAVADVQSNGFADAQSDDRADAQTDGRAEASADGRADAQPDGRADAQSDWQAESWQTECDADAAPDHLKIVVTDLTTPAPTPAPSTAAPSPAAVTVVESAAPSAAAVTVVEMTDDDCADSATWQKAGKPTKDCAWAAKDTARRCARVGEDGTTALAS
ncbi:hypothetical protein M885DRAFT_576897, partial [Pelagophyceae sp. CCMP2097]